MGHLHKHTFIFIYGLKVEIQIRSVLQHAWATAVETVGTFIKQALKSSVGEADWLRFFALMGTAIAYREGAPLVPNTLRDRTNIVEELRIYIERLDVATKLNTYGATLRTLEGSAIDAQYYLLKLDPSANQVVVTGFKAQELERAANST